MNERLLRELAAKSMVVMLGVTAMSYGLGAASVATASFEENLQIDSSRIVSEGDSETAQIYKNLETGVAVNQLKEPYLMIEKPESETLEVSVKDLYMEKSIQVFVGGLTDKVLGRGSLYENSGAMDCVKRVNLVYDYLPEDFSYTAVYTVELDKVYGYQLYEDKDAFYIELWEPSSLYDRILVVDAGHGGNDVGAYTDDMKYYEKDINLGIVKYLKKLLDEEEIKVYYTRLSDEKVYLNPRIDLANELKADLMISIHCNSSDTSASANGCEVLYGTENQEQMEFKSRDLASVCLKAMTKDGSISNRGLVKKDDIYIIGKSRVPIALVEVGFMSNQEDIAFLVEKDNQKKIAEYMYDAVIKAFSALEKKN